MTNDKIKELWREQLEWSGVADLLKSDLTTWRNRILWMSIAGAFLATLATQAPDGAIKSTLAALAAVMFGLVAAIRLNKNSSKQTEEWTRARAISESLKAELYTYNSQAEPYKNPDNALKNLTSNCTNLTNTTSAKKLQRYKTKVSVDDNKIEDKAKSWDAPDVYIQKRVKDQIDWYKSRAKDHENMATKLHRWEFRLTIFAVIFSAISGYFSVVSLWSWNFELAAWVAVLTTIGGTLTAHVAASRYDHIVISYSATAKQLNDLNLLRADSVSIPSPEWSTFVRKCEDAISKENESWVAKWAKEEENN